MRILVVSPYAPLRDGIASYTVQYVAGLRSAGHDVEVLSPTPTAALHTLRFGSWRGPLALAKRTGAYDRVVLQFHPDFFFPRPCNPALWSTIALGLAAALRRARSSEIVVHEFDYLTVEHSAQARRAAQILLRAVSRVSVHTTAERDLLTRKVGLPTDRVRVIEHGRYFRPRTTMNQDQARRSLGIEADARVFLCIGFIQPHKGFDRALRAFAHLDQERNRLYVVGSVRVQEPEYVHHLSALQALAATLPGAELVVDYISDEMFDRWIVATDVVVLPYRLIWSSGVLERANLFSKPVIVSDVGGLRDQAPAGTDFITSDSDLLAAMARHAAGSRRRLAHEPAALASPLVPQNSSREHVMRILRDHATALRGHELSASERRSQDLTSTGISDLASLPPLAMPTTWASTRTKRMVKRVMMTLTRWQLEPLVGQINAVHRAAIRSHSDGAPDR